MTRRLLIDYAIDLAFTARGRAACTRRQVGSSVLTADGRVAALGYNGTPAGTTHCTDGGCPRGAFTHDQIPGGLGNAGHDVPCLARHAEANATSWAIDHGADPTTSLVAITCAPCRDCEAMLRDAAWAAVVWSTGRDDGPMSVHGWGDWTPWQH